MNAIEMVQGIVEIIVDSGAAESVWPIQMKGVTRTRSTKTTKSAVAVGSFIRVDRDATLEFVRGGRRCNIRILDADVREGIGFRECDRGRGKRGRIRT